MNGRAAFIDSSCEYGKNNPTSRHQYDVRLLIGIPKSNELTASVVQG